MEDEEDQGNDVMGGAQAGGFRSPEKGESEFNPTAQSPVQLFSQNKKSRIAAVLTMASEHVELPESVTSSPMIGVPGAGLRELKEENSALMDMICRLNDHFAKLKEERAKDSSAWSRERESLMASNRKADSAEEERELFRQETSFVARKIEGMEGEVGEFLHALKS